MDHRDAVGDLGQRQRPVDGGVAAARDHHALAAEGLAVRDIVEDALAFVGLDARQGRPVGTEGADAGGDDHGARLHHRALGGRDLPEPAAQLLQALHLLAEVIDRPEGRRLRLQPHHQLGRLDAGKARDVVDRLLGIERRALAAGIVEHVDDVATQPHHAAFEHGEQADGPRAYDDDVGLMRMSAGHGPNVAKEDHKIKGLIARPGMELALSSDDGCQRQLRRVPARAARAARPRQPAAHVRQDRRVLRRRDVRDGDRQHALPAGRRRQPGGLRGSPRPLRPSTTRRAAAPSTSPSGGRRSGCSTNPTSLSPGRGSRWRRRAGSRPSADGRAPKRSRHAR